MTNSVFLAVISQMVTPAILIMAAGSLVSTTMLRLTRITDRARELVREGRAAHQAGQDESLVRINRMLRELEGRSWLSERSLIASYSAIGMFLGCVLSIALTDLLKIWYWLPVIFALAGARCSSSRPRCSCSRRSAPQAASAAKLWTTKRTLGRRPRARSTPACTIASASASGRARARSGGGIGVCAVAIP